MEVDIHVLTQKLQFVDLEHKWGGRTIF